MSSLKVVRVLALGLIELAAFVLFIYLCANKEFGRALGAAALCFAAYMMRRS